MNAKSSSTIILLVVLSCFSICAEQSPSSASESGIEGTISIGPIHGGPARIGVPNSKPLADTEFVVKSDTGAVANFKTDAQGHFRVVLAPGHYTASKSGDIMKIGRCGPFEFDVVAGQMTKLQWHCDTGMR